MAVSTELPVVIDIDEIQRLMEVRDIPSRNALARLAGIHKQHLYEIFGGQGSPTLATIAKLCRALRVQPGDILYYDPDGEDDIEPDIESDS